MTDLKQPLSNLEKNIQYKCKDTVWNHLWTLFSFTQKYAGIVDEKGFKVWKYSRGQGIFYFTITGTIVEEKKELVLETKLNKLAKTLITIWFLVMLYFFLDSTIEYKQAYDGSYYFWYIDWKEIGRVTLLSLVFSSIMIPLLYYVYRVRKKEELENLTPYFSDYSNSTNQDYF
jgi:hypothetical protein